MKSIFTEESNQPVPNTAYHSYTFKNKAVFTLSGSSVDKLRELSPAVSSETISLLESEGFWEILITTFTERHADAYQVTKVLSDTFVGFAMGAVPVQVNIDGFLFMTRDEDHRIDFMKIYDALFRGSRAQELGAEIIFTLLGTTMKLWVTRMQLSHTVNYSDVAQVSISGVGVKYATTMIDIEDDTNVDASSSEVAYA